MKTKTTTLMFTEASESPDVVQRQLDRNVDTVQRIGRKLKGMNPGFILTCARGISLITAGVLHDAAINLPTYAAHPAIEPMLRILSFYRMANQLSLQLGLNPDCPPYLHKVTSTV